MALALSPFMASWLLQLMFQLDAARQRHSVNATRDDLTGAPNRRHFMQVAEREWARCRRYAEDGALLLIDADQFKSLKSSHGSACCDALLRDLTRLVTQSLRQPDLLARYGAEALIVYLPNTDPMGALDVAERIRERVAGHTLRWQNGGVSSTVSIGVASVGAAHVTLDALVQDAQAALQSAKDAGRNCVRAAPIQPRATPVRPPSQAQGGPRARRP
jgi:diguanylate cyclase (GGDEF)-like protein